MRRSFATVLPAAALVCQLLACSTVTPGQPTTTPGPVANATLPPPTQPATQPPPTSLAEVVTEQPPDDQPVKMTKWDLWSSGVTLLRGMNVHQRIIYQGWDDPAYYGDGPVGPVFVQADFDRLAALGANYVNISHPGLFTVDAPFSLDEASQANLDRLLDMIAQADMFAVISFRTGPGRSELTFWGVGVDDEMGQSLLNDSVWENPAAQDAWVEMWRYTAERYRGNPVVAAYDLMVEPNANAVFFDVYSPEEFYPAQAGTLYDWNQLYPRLVGAVREADRETPILVGAMSFSHVEWLPYLSTIDDPHTVYAVHQYAPFEYTHQQPDEAGRLVNTYPGDMDLDWDGQPDRLDRAWLEQMLLPVREFQSTTGRPVAVNEYGVTRFEPGAAAYLDDLIGLLEELGANHALWSWTSAHVLAYGAMQEFEYRLGPDIANLTDEVPNPLMDVIVRYWQQNTLRPSTMSQ